VLLGILPMVYASIARVDMLQRDYDVCTATGPTSQIGTGAVAVSKYLGFCVCGPHCQSAGTVAAAHVRLYSAGDSIGGVPTGAGAIAEPAVGGDPSVQRISGVGSLTSTV